MHVDPVPVVAAMLRATEAAALAAVATDPIEAVRLALLALQFRQNGSELAPSRDTAR
jgi:hypothetical protein